MGILNFMVFLCQFVQNIKHIRQFLCINFSQINLGIHLSDNIYNFNPILRSFLDSLFLKQVNLKGNSLRKGYVVRMLYSLHCTTSWPASQ